MSSLLAKLKKNSRIDSSATLDESKFFNQGDNNIPTDVPMINVALSGDLDKGLTSGLTVLAGPSKHFKTSFALIMVAAYMRKHPESIVLFYDSEFGSPQAYFKTFGIDTSRVLHCPIMNVEDLKFDIMKQLDGIEKSDKVIIMIDSVGNLASKKEVEDAMNEKSVADMTRAKAFKSLFRMVTPHLSMKDIPIVAIGHTYKTQDMYPKDVLSGGTGLYYSANTVWILGRQQDKDENGLQGYHFVINVDKSRFVKEKSKVPISVSFANGVEKYSGLLDVCVEGGFVIKPTQGWYQKKGDTVKYREKDTYTAEFWKDILESKDFKDYIRTRYTLGGEGQSGLTSIVDDEADES
jgi:RecA/RadA recombinase